MIAILPRSNLAAVVDIMQASERVAGMMVAEDLDTRELSAMATRVLAGDIFGLEKLIAWGTQIHSFLVGDYQEKSLCISQISEFAEAMGVRRKYRESIEQCLDEMLMNALYDAPVDEQGQPDLRGDPDQDADLAARRAEGGRAVRVRRQAVRDRGARRVRHARARARCCATCTSACTPSSRSIARPAARASGLYLMASSSTSVFFNVLPGVATEAVCTFDLEAPKLQLESFGFFTEKIDAAGRLAAGPSRRLPAGATHPVERRARHGGRGAARR